MIFQNLPLEGALLIRPNRHADERGYFARTYCRETFLERGLKDCSHQCSVSFNTHRGTLRGLHFQAEPHAETKLIRCARGHVFDVIVDLREESPNFGRWHAEHLNAANGLSLYVPAGFAHGFVTLADDTELIYQMAEPFVPGSAAGIAWNDPDIAIDWPLEPLVMSLKDRSLPTLKFWRNAE
jgi:dTDP-4-dehydrorhamnose 3,5-epimerase